MLEDLRYFMNIQVIIRDGIRYIRFKKTGRIIVFVPNKTDLWDTLELLVTRPTPFYTVLCSIHTNIYLHTNTKTHTYLRYTFHLIDNFVAQSVPRGFITDANLYASKISTCAVVGTDVFHILDSCDNHFKRF